MPPTTFVKLDRSIQNWRWYKNANVARLFIHLLINANFCEHEFENITVHRGELVTSQASLAAALNLSVQNIRTALKKLQASGELTVTAHHDFSVITVNGYNKYQSEQQAANRQLTGRQQAVNNQPTGNQQATDNNIRSEEVNNEITKEINNESMREVCVEEQSESENNTASPSAVLSPEEPHAYGKNRNVYLTNTDYENLDRLYGKRLSRLIDELSLKISLSPERYSDGAHVDRIHLFALHDKKQNQSGYSSNFEPDSFNSRCSYDLKRAQERALMLPKSTKKRNRQTVDTDNSTDKPKEDYYAQLICKD